MVPCLQTFFTLFTIAAAGINNECRAHQSQVGNILLQKSRTGSVFQSTQKLALDLIATKHSSVTDEGNSDATKTTGRRRRRNPPDNASGLQGFMIYHAVGG